MPKSKRAKLGQKVLVYLLYHISKLILGSHSVPIDSFLDQDGREKKEQFVKDLIWMFKVLQTLCECSYIYTRSGINMEIPLTIRDRSNAQQSFKDIRAEWKGRVLETHFCFLLLTYA